MKITEVETHVVCPPFHAWNSEALSLFQGPDFRYRTIFVVRTDSGLEGLGEQGGRDGARSKEWVERLRGTSPLDWLAHPALPVGLAAAVYDLVGRHNQVPAYKLFGPRVRDRVPVASWTVSQTPQKMAEEVKHAAESGFTWLKYHTSHFHNIVAQTKAMQAVAPPGFRVHYDLNWDSTVEHIMELARALERLPIAGAFEDPVRNEDFDGYRLLRQKCPLPLYFHHLHLGGREAMMGLADGYMLGHTPVGQVIQRAGLFEAANVPFMTQNVGGAITLAFIAQMAAALPMATLHHVTAFNLWAEDVVTPTFQVAGGTVRVPEGTGLGVTLDRAALARWSEATPDPLPRALVQIRYAGMPPVYARPPAHLLSDRESAGPSFMDGYGAGYNHPVDMDYWRDDGSRRFKSLWERTSAGPVAEA